MQDGNRGSDTSSSIQTKANAAPEPTYSFVKTGISGAVSQAADLLTLGHILNRIAIEQQASPQQTPIGAFLSIVKKNPNSRVSPIRNLYRGLRWNAAAGVARGATRWALNAELSRLFTKILGSRSGGPLRESEKHRPDRRLTVALLVGVTGAFVESIVQCPFEFLKTREMTRTWGNANKSVQMRALLQNEVRAMRVNSHTSDPFALGSILYRGWLRIFLRQTITWTTYTVAFDRYRALIETWPGREKRPFSFWEKVLASGLTGVTASLFSTPFDLLRTQAQKDPTGLNLTNAKLLDTISVLSKQFGYRVMLRSFPLRACRSVWYSVSTFLVMDYLDALPIHMKV